MRYRVDTYESDNKLLAGVNGLRSPVHITLDPDKVSPDEEGSKYFEPFWVAKSGDMGRPLPRTRLSANVRTTDTVLPVEFAQAFVPGDQVYVIPASADIELATSWNAGDSITINIAGIDFTHVASAALTGEGFATEAAAAFNDNPQTRELAQAIASTGSLTITAKDFVTPHAISVSSSGGFVTASNTLLLPYQLVGEVASVDVKNKQLTLTSTASVSAAKGVPVGTADVVIGFHLRAHDLREQALEAGLYTSLSGKRGAFPYLDDGLERQFVEIQAVNA